MTDKYWNKVCSLEKYSFYIDEMSLGVRRGMDKSGNWVEYSEVQKIAEQADNEIRHLREIIKEFQSEMASTGGRNDYD